MSKKYDVFVSYGHADAQLIRPLIELLRLNGRRVFLDTAIEPGTRWKHAILESLRQAQHFVLIWCCHAAESEWVAREVRTAIREEKGIAPVLLCGVEPPDAVSRYQWIDLRGVVKHACSMHDQITTETLNAFDVGFIDAASDEDTFSFGGTVGEAVIVAPTARISRQALAATHLASSRYPWLIFIAGASVLIGSVLLFILNPGGLKIWWIGALGACGTVVAGLGAWLISRRKTVRRVWQQASDAAIELAVKVDAALASSAHRG
jgi:hypothetical protein